MVKNNHLLIAKAVLVTFATMTGFFILNEIVQSPLELLAIIGLSTFYFVMLPFLIKRTKANVKSILFSAAVLIAPLVPMRLFFHRPLDTRISLMGISSGKPIVIIASIVFLFCVFAISLLSAWQKNSLDHNNS